MATRTPKPDPKQSPRKGEDWTTLVGRVTRASMGAVQLARREVEDFVGRLVEKGELAEKDGRRLLEDLLRRQRETSERFGRDLAGLRRAVDSRVQDSLSRVRFPTRREVEDLTARVAALAERVERIEKSLRKR